MTPPAWIALASLGVVLFVQSAVVSFIMGRLFQRVETLEKSAPSLATMVTAVTTLEVKLDALVTRVDDSIGWLMKVEDYQHQQQRQPQPHARAKP